MKFVLEINCDNAAFEDNVSGEVARILRNLVGRFDEDEDLIHGAGPLKDINGNKVGKWALHPEDSDEADE